MNPKYLNRLKRIDNLIQHKSTGTPKVLARKIGLSESKTYEYLRFLKSLGAPVKYSKVYQSYYYEQTGKLVVEFMEDN